MKRSSGILMPIFSLPSPYGIGTLGEAAYEFADFLEKAGQTWWQLLPMGPTSFGDSPYQSPSAYAGNPWFIDLDLLIRDGLLKNEEVQGVHFGDKTDQIDYAALYQNRPALLRKAAIRGIERDKEKVRVFEEENKGWLPDYTLFMAIKKHFAMRSWMEWPDEELRLRKPEALERARKEFAEEIGFSTYVQYLFFRQWEDLKVYVKKKQIQIMGDMALYVALDSADVWASPENFLLDEKNCPKEVAGVPPDAFTAAGQLWGNPLYDYDHMKQDGYRFWINRVQGASRLYDAVRIDHFRGIESYWAVPAGEKTAKNGHWVKGPGMSLVGTLKKEFPDLQFVAEDLGYPTEEVKQLLTDSVFPGMQVLQFVFDSNDPATDLPEKYPENCICYTGTHDNHTVQGWMKNAVAQDRENAEAGFRLNEKEGFARGFIREGMKSAANLFVAGLWDWLELGDEARINTPGTLDGNWRWRLLKGQIPKDLAEQIKEMTILYKRNRAQSFSTEKGDNRKCQRLI